MHVQIKATTPPPDNMCAKVGGILVHDHFKAKQRNDKWIYEATGSSNTSLQIPAWIDPATVTISIHDEELHRNGVAHIICATSGKPLIPYYVPVQHLVGMPDACFSLSFSFVHIEYAKSINYLRIRRVEPMFIGGDAAIMTEDLFNGPVMVRNAFCKTCNQEFDIMELHDLDHNVVVSTFSVPDDLDYLRRAIRAATQKAWGPKPSRAYYVYAERRTEPCSI